ncbi:unnamed protein product [Mytilus coruscus]|uniref:Endonuclease/exonuclease/phosphatase domain-containing protein n=1 Tax=Mytilus coruscus TaxID=42192 RepID=A0A6J8DY96_MYTCO|nr:unnamed protein product [Mytilus coruscus]
MISLLDNLTKRNVIDYTVNSYVEIFNDFLTNASLCLLNGRNYIHDDFTSISTKGSSVVDYCAVPYENLSRYKNFEVIRASVLCNKSEIPGIINPQHISDHSMLCWELEANFSSNSEIKANKCSVSSKNQNQKKSVSYNVKNIPNNWMSDQVSINSINECIHNIECSDGLKKRC